MGQLPGTEGVHRFDPLRKDWERLQRLTPSELQEGCNFIYFRNVMCVPCRVFDLKFPDVLRAYSCRCSFFVVTCGFYGRLCMSRPAKEAFSAFKVKEGPTIYVALVRGGRPAREAVIVGNPSISELRSYLYKNLGLRACRST